jgi:hypothetical protein
MSFGHRMSTIYIGRRMVQSGISQLESNVTADWVVVRDRGSDFRTYVRHLTLSGHSDDLLNINKALRGDRSKGDVTSAAEVEVVPQK